MHAPSWCFFLKRFLILKMKDKVKSRGSSLDDASLSTLHVTVFHSDLTYHAHAQNETIFCYIFNFHFIISFFCDSVIAGNFNFLTKKNNQCEDMHTYFNFLGYFVDQRFSNMFQG